MSRDRIDPQEVVDRLRQGAHPVLEALRADPDLTADDVEALSYLYWSIKRARVSFALVSQPIFPAPSLSVLEGGEDGQG